MPTRPEPPPRSPFDPRPPAAAAPPELEAPALEGLGYSPDDLSPVHAELGPLVSHWADSRPAPRPGAEALGRAALISADTSTLFEVAAEAGLNDAWEDPFAQLEGRWTLDGAWARLSIISNKWRAEAPERLITPAPFQESAPMPPMSAWLIRRVSRGSRWLR